MIGRNRIPSLLRKGAKRALCRTLYRKAVYRPEASERPFLVRLDINNTCNLECKQCFYADYKRSGVAPRNLSLDEFKRIADRLFPYTYVLQFACAFEPTMNPDFPAMVRLLDDYGIYDVGTVTNATLLDGERAQAVAESRSISSVAVSIDGISPETYEKIRGRPLLGKVLANIAGFQEIKRQLGKERPYIKLNTVVMRSNLHELPALMKWAIEHEIDEVQFFHVEPFDRSTEESVLNVPDEYNRIHDAIGEVAAGARTRLMIPPPLTPEYFDRATGLYLWGRLEENLRSAIDTAELDSFYCDLSHPYPENVHCICPWMTLMVDAWGRVYPCAHRRDVAYGNILDQPLDEAINTMRFLKLRRAMLQGRHAAYCHFCKPQHPYSDPMKRRLTRLLSSDR
ncbi:radical SAM protein [Candidatus Sumerlaeota bacterium]|nr:radical SAM protein [Candidatus Sumerlaeota bacterium]